MPQWFFDILGLIILFGIASIMLCLVMILLGMQRYRKPYRYGASTQLLRHLPVDPGDLELNYENLQSPRGDEYWRVEGENKDLPILIYLHPWAGSRYEIVHLLPVLVERFSSVYLMDMTGHGDAKGAFDGGQQSLKDLQSLMGTALDRQPGQRFVLMGRGLGFNLALKVTHEHVEAIIGDSLVTESMGPVERLYLQYRLPNLTLAVKYACRLFKCDPDFLIMPEPPVLPREIKMLKAYTISSRPDLLEQLDDFLGSPQDPSETQLMQAPDTG